MTTLRPTLAALLAALVLAAPAAADRGTQQALAQERTYTHQATVSSARARPVPERDNGSSLAPLAIAGACVLVAVSGALVARRRRPRFASAPGSR
jgi:hypothetical protein